MLFAVIVVGLAAAATVLFAFSAASWKRPVLGTVDGRLRPCGQNPNCVCSEDSRDSHSVAPFTFEGDADAEFRRLQSLVESAPRTTLIDQRDGYLRFESVTPLLRYVDDVEFRLDADAGLIHVRSASRIGRSDFGVNRARVEELRRYFNAGSPAPRN